WPLSAGLQATVNWVTEARGGERLPAEDALKLAGQLSLTRQLADGVGVAVVPGVLVNPAEDTSGEPLLVTVGLAGRWRFAGNLSVVAEWVPIVAGYTRTATFGNDNRFDTWGSGLEIATGGHVFQIVLTN